MKRVVVMVEAAADFPYPELRDQTPLETARSPHARRLAREGRSGVMKLRGEDASHAMALLCRVCGFTPGASRKVSWGALAARAVDRPPDSSRYRALGHFITVVDGVIHGPAYPDSEAEQVSLLGEIEGRLREVRGDDTGLWSMGKGRFMLEMPRFDARVRGRSVTPTDLRGKRMTKVRRRLSGELREVLEVAKRVLDRHAINQVRVDLGQNPINGIWLWSGGVLSGVRQADALAGQALMSVDPLASGLGRALGIPVMGMEDPYRLDRIDAAFDVEEFMRLLDRREEVVVWVPAPFSRDQVEGPEEKVRRLDAIDYYVTGPIRAVLEKQHAGRMLLLSAGLRHRGRPEKGRAPFVLWGQGVSGDGTDAWNERQGLRGAMGSPKLETLLQQMRS